MTVLTAVLAIVFTNDYVVQPARVARGTYTGGQPLPFAGATLLHLPREEVRQFANIVNTLRVRCRSVITMPGMHSLNLWSGLPPPSGMTEQPWWAVLSPAQLQTALTRARAADGLCLVRNDYLVAFWSGFRPGFRLPQVPLVRFLEGAFTPIAHYGFYTISVRTTAGNAQRIAPPSPTSGATAESFHAEVVEA